MPLQDLTTAEHIFGRGVLLYAPTIKAALPELLEQEYVFIPDDIWAEDVSAGRLPPAQIGQLYWLETLQRAQLAATITLIRTASWIDVASREYRAGSLPSWAAACRSLLEGIGDSGDALNYTALTLAEHAAGIREELAGRGVGSVSTELDEVLIRFTHGRHVPRGEDAPSYHRAKSAGEHIAIVASMGLEGAMSFYGVLCELMHPAQASMAHLYVATEGGGFKLTLEGERAALEAVSKEHRETLHQLLPLALNPALLTLRVVGGFGVLTPSRAIEGLELSPIAIWPRIREGMCRAGIAL